MKNKSYRPVTFYKYILLISSLIYFSFAIIYDYSTTIQDPMPIEHRLFTAIILLFVYVMTQSNKWVKKRIERITYLTAVFLIIQLIYVSYLKGFELQISINIFIVLAIVNLIFKGDRFALNTNIILVFLVTLSLILVKNPNQPRLGFFIGYITVAGLTYYISNQNYKTYQALQESEERYKTIFKTAPFGILLQDKNGTILEVNETLCEITGYDKDELEGAKLTDTIVSPSQVEAAKKHIAQILNGKDLELDTTTVTKDNEEIYTYLKESSIILPNGEQGILSMQLDITERKRQEEIIKKQRDTIEELHSTALKFMELETEEEILEMTINAAKNLLDFEFCNIRLLKNDKLVCKVTTSGEPNTISANEGLAGKTFKKGESILIDNFDNSPEFEPENKNYKSGMSIPIKNLGVFQAVSLETEAFSNEDLELAELLISHTASALERIYAEEEIRYKSFHDKLTSLYNRRYFEEEVDRLDTERQLPLSIIMTDINGLKSINDSLGHKKGDQLLIKTANILKKSIRDEDILARWGGDEFAILLPKTNRKETKRVLKRIKEKTAETKEDKLTVSLGIGFATKTSMDQKITKILKEADRAMYKNKSQYRK